MSKLVVKAKTMIVTSDSYLKREDYYLCISYKYVHVKNNGQSCIFEIVLMSNGIYSEYIKQNLFICFGFRSTVVWWNRKRQGFCYYPTNYIALHITLISL